MYHAMAQTIFIAGGPKRGIPVYIMKKFDFVTMLETVQKYRITTLLMVPPIVVVSLLTTTFIYSMPADTFRHLQKCLSSKTMILAVLLRLVLAQLHWEAKSLKKLKRYGQNEMFTLRYENQHELLMQTNNQ